MSPNQREDKLRVMALLVMVGSEGSSRVNVEHNESKPKVAYKVGNPKKYRKNCIIQFILGKLKQVEI